jgi:hypothetical protein
MRRGHGPSKGGQICEERPRSKQRRPDLDRRGHVQAKEARSRGHGPGKGRYDLVEATTH